MFIKYTILLISQRILIRTNYFYLLLFLSMTFIVSIQGSSLNFKDEERSNIEDLQRQWAHPFIEADNVISADPTVNKPSELFSQLPQQVVPVPDLYHLYLKKGKDSYYSLVKDPQMSTIKFIKIFPVANGNQSNYTTFGSPHTVRAKETLVHPAKIKSRAKRNYPTARSTSYSYPTGVKTYHFTSSTGMKIQFDRGHGIPHADTQEHSGRISTQDPENYVPQNIKYNNPIRRVLEKEFSDSGLRYKEISIYHPTHMYPVVTKVNQRRKAFNIPIPEGFLLISFFTEDNTVKDVYYFPNFVDYEVLKGNNKNYKDFKQIYKIDCLSNWFLLPKVSLGNPQKQIKRTDLAASLASSLLDFAPTLFKNLSETQMPPKAKVALLLTLFEWNMQTAATIEFLDFKNQLNLVTTYLTRYKVWQLDGRTLQEKNEALELCQQQLSHSPTASNIMMFIQNNREHFWEIQKCLFDFIRDFDEAYRNSSPLWKKPEFNSKMLCIILNNKIYDFNILEISKDDIEKFQALVGGTSLYDRENARSILTIIDSKARAKNLLIKDTLGIMRLYHDYPELYDKSAYHFWETYLLNNKLIGEKNPLLALRMICDFYSYRKHKIEKAFYMQRFLWYVLKHPSEQVFYTIGEFVLTNRSIFWEDLSDQLDDQRAGNILALMIFQGLKFYGSIYTFEHLEGLVNRLLDQLNFMEEDVEKIKEIVFFNSVSFDWLSSGEAGRKLKQLYYAFLQFLFPRNYENKRKVIEKDGKALLSGNSFDYGIHAQVFYRLGYKEQAANAARICMWLAQTEKDFLNATKLLLLVGLKDQAKIAASKYSSLAETYRDHILAYCAMLASEKNVDLKDGVKKLQKLGFPDIAKKFIAMVNPQIHATVNTI